LENASAVDPQPPDADGEWTVIVAAAFGIVVGALAVIVARRRRSSATRAVAGREFGSCDPDPGDRGRTRRRSGIGNRSTPRVHARDRPRRPRRADPRVFD